jgi:peptide deformylase
MKQPIIIFPDDRLTTVCEPVTDFGKNLHNLVRDLFDTMYASDGIGLAAPQIGVLSRVFVVDVREGKKPFNPIAFINSELLVKTGNAEDIEGCLSMPGLELTIRRATYVYCSFDNLDGHSKLYHQLHGLEARVFQHELDHLAGILFTGRATPEELARAARETVMAGKQ